MSLTAQRSGIGEPVRRKEDLRLVTGKGCFSDDVNLPGQVYAIMVRSPHAHARILGIDIQKALASPGVLAVLTGRDMLADGLKPIPHHPFSLHPAEIRLVNKDGSPIFAAPHYPLTPDKARYVGEAVAMVIAQTVAAAHDGAELVDVEYEILPAVTDTVAAAQPDALRLWDEAPSNVCLDAEAGDGEATEAAFARAAHVVRFETWVQRVTGVPMEPRAAVCAYDAATRHYTLYAGSGGAVRLKHDLAAMLNVSGETVRVVMHDVGGNFGTRAMIYPEFALVAWAARRVGRPVKWTCERQEAFDLAARQCGFDRLALRRRNLLTEAELPHTNPFGMIYDSGDYHQVMEKALKLGDWSGFAERRAEARKRGKCRGIGVANYVDTATGVPRERAEVTVHPEGRVDVVIGIISNGQGHETSFAQPGSWRDRTGRRASAARTLLLRPGHRAAPFGLVHGLRDAAGGLLSVLQDGDQRGALRDPSAWHAAGGRGRHNAGPRRSH